MTERLFLKKFPLKNYCAFGTGGSAELYFEPADKKDLIKVLQDNSLDVTVIGLGFNTLIRDGGVDGLMIKLANPEFKKIYLDGEFVYAGCGTSIREILDYCIEKNLGGLEFMASIPGSLGGALKGNAGAFGRSIGEAVERLNCVRISGESITYSKDQVKFSYRNLEGIADDIIVETVLKINLKPGYDVALRIADFKEKRTASFVKGLSCGSVFKNPENIKAWELIEKAGLRGRRSGKARFSEEHANWIVAEKGVESKDIEGLINMAKKEVKMISGIDLLCEIVLIGNNKSEKKT